VGGASSPRPVAAATPLSQTKGGFARGSKVRRRNLPPTILNHLLDRIQKRKIAADQLGLLAEWLDTQPEAPGGKWFKKFPGMTVCGEGELVKTFLPPGQALEGEEVR
jgi:hypothetical protein